MKQQRLFDDLITCPRCRGNGVREYNLTVLFKSCSLIKIKCRLCNGHGKVNIHYAKQHYKDNKKMVKQNKKG